MHVDAVDLDVAAPLVAAVQQGAAFAVERRTIGVLAGDLDLESILAVWRNSHHPGHFPFARQVPAKAPVACQGLAFGRSFQPLLPGRVVQRITLGQHRHHLGTGQIKPVTVAGQGLIFQRRPLPEVEVHQPLPFLSRTPLQGNPRAGVATGAHLRGLLVEMFDRVQASLQGIAHAVRFARRQALSVSQVFDQGPAILIADLQAVHGLHPGNAHQPAFRGFALVADTAQAVVGFGDMTAHTVLLEDALGIAGSLAVRCMQA